MHSKFTITHHGLSPAAPCFMVPDYYRVLCKFEISARSTAHHGVRFKLVAQSPDDRWKLNDANVVQGRVNSWLLKTQNFLNEVTSPLVKSGHVRNPDPGKALDVQDMDDVFVAEQTIDSRTPNGNLSLAAIVSIEQFSRMNGLTGQKMQKIFAALVPESVCNDARNLVEYCCFRFLSRDNSDIHPSLKDPAFQRLIFITMLAWENPYAEENDSYADISKNGSFQGRLVREKAFVRIAPAIAGLSDRSTAHNLFKALSGDEGGISLSLFSVFIDEFLKVIEGRKSYHIRECPDISGERILCIGSSRKQPVLKWKNNMAWPGKLTLTNEALYFEAIEFMGQKGSGRLDLTRHGSLVEKTRVGPFGSALFDSAVSVSSAPESETWVLEFVDFKGEMRRDIWHAFICEVIALHKFIDEYGPGDDGQSISHVYGAEKGKERATIGAINSIARLQAIHFIRNSLDDPTKLVQFSYLQHAPFGDVVCQTLAVNYWGGQLVTKFAEAGNQPAQGSKPSEVESEINNHVFDVDGSVYLQNWMKSPSWSSTSSIMFWKSAYVRQGLVLSKNLVVADLTLVEKAAATCKHKFQVAENTQATIDAAMIKGIPSNIDLFKELVLPLTIVAKNFDKLRCWEEPHLTISFLAFTYAIIFRNLLSYIIPTSLMILASSMLLLKGLKEQGRLGRSFGKVTISDQPPTNTIQKIIAVKEAMDYVENFLQNMNVMLLKIRTIVLSGQPQITTEVALVLLVSATILLIVPFKYVLAFLLFDIFTRELNFRREMVRKFMRFIKERWDTVPAAPVVVLPFKSAGTGSASMRGGTRNERNKSEGTGEQR
ncbi:uncharacterized protein LOC131163780 [Malania oleifera]|uniref:uncharacterized protein LOC131163780 n=1 Tax=Malania oleifera TaxID=397392 RepID=UPI0025AEA21B|nr:uncharacterized protein LOC131163780 [Malania oleifera]XP_057976504.1 uncharacterized protein LOC131163780 [Malania oleifera]